MSDSDWAGAPQLKGKNFGLLGNGCLFAWNSMLTIEDYYVYLFPKNHPTRVLTLVYQPFALGVSALLAYHEAKINTRLRNLTGYTIYFLSSFGIIICTFGELTDNVVAYVSLGELHSTAP